MATKTTSKKSTKRKTGTTGTVKRPKKKAAAESADKPAVVTPEETGAETSATTSRSKRRTTSSQAKQKKTTTKRKRKSTAKKPEVVETVEAVETPEAEENEEVTAVAEEAPPAPPSGGRVKAYSPDASVAEENGGIVIRFPPVAPPPFESWGGRPAARAPVAEPEDAADALFDDEPASPAIVDEEEAPEPPAWMEETAEDEGEEPSAPTATVDDEPVDEGPRHLDDSLAHMTASKKRRLRRKRHRDKGPEGDESVEEDEPSETAAPVAEVTDEDETEPDEPAILDAEPLEVEVEEEVLAEESAPAEAPPARERRGRRRHRGRRSSRQEADGEAPRLAPAPGADGDGEAAAPRETQAPRETRAPREAPAAREPHAPREDRERREGRDRRGRGRPSGEVRVAETPAEAAGPKVTREMIINAVPREECRIGILVDGRLEEIYFERATSENHVGNIYKGVVTNVEPSIQAAFIDFGQGKNGFLHISDLHPQYFPDGHGHTENVGHKMPRRSRPPIQRCLRRGQEVIVQVTKEGIGTKGPTLSTYLSIPGRFLVMMPGMGRLGVSRRIEDDESRDKLRAALAELELPEGMGFIARTAALDRSKRELQGDLTYLTRLWRAVENRTKNEPAPAELYRESDLVIRTIRDVFTSDIERIVVDDEEVAERARDFLSIFSPRSSDIVNVYGQPEPIFHKYGIEAELERLHSRRVPLKSGGSLVIEPTEALVAIDVNSGRFRTEDDAEATAYKINVEAADEIARQLRLRDLGGVVVCDFIDMRHESHRRDIERRLARNLKDHKERAKVLRMSDFGIIELTRQRQRASLTRSVYQDCRHCRGTGLVKTVESVALDVMRLIQLAVTRDNINMIEVSVSPDVSFLLQNRKRRLLYELESRNRRIVSLRPDPAFSLDQVEIRCTDARGRLVPHA